MHLVNRLNQSTVSYYIQWVFLFHFTHRRDATLFFILLFLPLGFCAYVACCYANNDSTISHFPSLALCCVKYSNNSRVILFMQRDYDFTYVRACYGNNCWHSTRCMYCHGSPFLILLWLLETSALWNIFNICWFFFFQYFIICTHMNYVDIVNPLNFFHFHLQSVSIR